MRKIREKFSITVACTVSLAIAVAGAGASPAQASAVTAYTAISNTGVLSDTATGSSTPTTLTGSSLADGITIAGGSTTTTQSYSDANGDIVSVGADSPSGTAVPTNDGTSMSISMPQATSPLIVHQMNGKPVYDAGTDSTTQASFSTNGVATFTHGPDRRRCRRPVHQ